MHSRIQRGEIYWVDFGSHSGTIEKVRPALVIQNNLGNMYSTKVIVAAIHGETPRKIPVSVSIPKGVAGLTKDSSIDCGNLATFNKHQVGKPIGFLPPEYMDKVDEALRISLAL